MARMFTAAEARNLTDNILGFAGALSGIEQFASSAEKDLSESLNKARNEKCRRALSEIKVAPTTSDMVFRVLDGADPSDADQATLLSLWQKRKDTTTVLSDAEHERSLEECLDRVKRGYRISSTFDFRDPLIRAVVLQSAKVLESRRLNVDAKGLQAQIQAAIDLDAKLDLIQATSGLFKRLLSSKERKEQAASAFRDLSLFWEGPLGDEARGLCSSYEKLPSLTERDALAVIDGNPQGAKAVIDEISPNAVGDDDWPFSSKEAGTVIGSVNQLIGSLKAELFDVQGADRAIRRSVDRMLATAALKALEEVPVDELNREKRGIRVKALKQAGYSTMADICAATIYNLEGVPGISHSSAVEIKSVARLYKARVTEDCKIKLSVDDRNKYASAVVSALCAKYYQKSLIEDRDKLLGELEQCTSSLLRDLAVANKPLMWLFASPAQIDAVSRSYTALQELLHGERADQARSLTGRFQIIRSNGIPWQEAWDVFSENSVAFYNILEEVVPGALGTDDERYGLPEDLAREIQDECFFPDGLKCTLRRYQEWGVKYILHQGKVLLGDEMGLGKTVQSVATMVSLKNIGATRFIVVCPASVLENWCREIRKHSKLRVTKLYGPSVSRAFSSWMETGGVAVTTFETTAKLAKIDAFSCDLITVDEAHYIKNSAAARTKNTLKICKASERLLFMTGTALENKVDEMLTLINDLNPAVATRAKPLAFLSGAKQFRDAIAPVYYRRKREDVLTELPDLIEKEEWCSLGAVEERAYEEAVLSRNFMAARRVSWNVPDLSDSSKAQRLLEIVREAGDDGRKMLVFTFFLDTARSIHALFGKRCVGVINGSVPPAKRQEMIEQFDAAPQGSILVAQIQSGGTGLNIQSASVVVLCEPQYKPSIENQAISRAYRMGQVRNVLVHRLLCERSVDERILNLLKQKQRLFDAFADKSSAAAAAAKEDIQITDQGFGKIIEEEIERIKAENPELAARVAARQGTTADSVGEGAGSESLEDAARAVDIHTEQDDADRHSEKRQSARHFKAQPEPAEPQEQVRVSEAQPNSYCIKCGRKLPEGALFCPDCGQPRAQ